MAHRLTHEEKQLLFNTSAAAMLKQGKQCRRAGRPVYYYQIKENTFDSNQPELRCAIGALMDADFPNQLRYNDGVVVELLEQNKTMSLLGIKIGPYEEHCEDQSDDTVRFLSHLQSAHDEASGDASSFVQMFTTLMKAVARKYHLNNHVIR